MELPTLPEREQLPSTRSASESSPLTASVERFLEGHDVVVDPDASADEADELQAMLLIHDLWMAPLERLGGRVVRQNDPAIVALKWDLERAFADRLRSRCPEPAGPTEEPAVEIRRIAAASALPDVYAWLEVGATWEELVRFLAMEGGPDAGFDDLVAMAQVGVRGDPKLCLAANYWDEMGRGDLDAVHTMLHTRLVEAVAMEETPRDALPVGVLERMALGGMLVTNRQYQPEALGALGLLEMQAGPRCRAVVRALDRLDAPPQAFPFYEEHARADPRHGKEWLDRVIAPLSTSPVWADGMVRGARWRAEVNRRFLVEAWAWLSRSPSQEPENLPARRAR